MPSERTIPHNRHRHHRPCIYCSRCPIPDSYYAVLGTRYAGAGSSSGGGGSGPRGGDINGDVWSDPRPFRVSSSSAEPCPSPSSSWASSDDTEDDNADSGGEGIGDAELDRWRRFEGEGDPLGGEIDAPVIVGQGSGLRKGSRSSAVSGKSCVESCRMCTRYIQ